MDYAEEAKPFDEVIEDKGVKIFIDPKAILFLIGTELDFVQEKLGARFVFNNPNQTSGLRLRRERADHAGGRTEAASYPPLRRSFSVISARFRAPPHVRR